MLSKQMNSKNQSTLQALFMIGLTLIMLLGAKPESAHACGEGCQQTMGSCSVDPDLWSAALNARMSGVRLTSCCRTPEYQSALRGCGYPAGTRSDHVSGRAVDLLVSPSQCNPQSLGRYGFSDVCPLYHFHHCHISMCANSVTFRYAHTSTLLSAREVRAANMRNSANIDLEDGPSFLDELFGPPSNTPLTNFVPFDSNDSSSTF